MIETPRGVDAKMHSRLREAGWLRSGVAKLFDVREFVKLFSLSNCKISSLLGRESNCSSATSYSCERGVNKEKLKNTDRATECAMTNVGENFLKIPSHSEDNNILSPKNLVKRLQADLSLSAQDDENVFFTMKFSGFRRSCIGRSALLCRHETNSVLFEECMNCAPSLAVLKLTEVR